jgi:hypothetical protein
VSPVHRCRSRDTNYRPMWQRPGPSARAHIRIWLVERSRVSIPPPEQRAGRRRQRRAAQQTPHTARARQFRSASVAPTPLLLSAPSQPREPPSYGIAAAEVRARKSVARDADHDTHAHIELLQSLHSLTVGGHRLSSCRTSGSTRP